MRLPVIAGERRRVRGAEEPHIASLRGPSLRFTLQRLRVGTFEGIPVNRRRESAADRHRVEDIWAGDLAAFLQTRYVPVFAFDSAEMNVIRCTKNVRRPSRVGSVSTVTAESSHANCRGENQSVAIVCKIKYRTDLSLRDQNLFVGFKVASISSHL